MARPTYDANLIGTLRARVIQHNAAGLGRPVKLGELKKAYEDGYRGKSLPGVRAMERVEELLKAASFDGTEHPRDPKGEFSSKGAAIPLPKSAADHARMQDDNAGYRALTTQAMPTTQHEVEGNLLRGIGSAAAGAGIVASLLRGRPNGFSVRAAKAVFGLAGRSLAAAPAGLAGIAVEGGAHVVAQGVRRALKRPLKTGGPSYAFASNVAGAAGSAGQAVGRAVGSVVGGGASHATRAVMTVAGRGAKTPAIRIARQGGAFAAMAAIPTAAINTSIAGGPVDPGNIGRGVDAFSHRIVEKIVALPEIEQARLEVRQIIADGGGLEELRKLNVRSVPGLITNVGRALGIGGAAIAGGAAGEGIGALAHHFGSKGNPNHDKRGRFSSKDESNAGTFARVGGAVAGAAATAGGVALALRTHNTHALGEAIEQLGGWMSRRVAAINSKKGYGHVREMIGNRQADINDAVQDDKGLTESLAHLDRYGASAPDHYKEAMRDETNSKLSSFLSHIEETTLPEGRSVADMRQSGTRPLTIHSTLHSFVATAKPKEFEAAISKLTPGQQETARHFYDNRQGWIDGVDEQIAGHKTKVDAAIAKHDAAEGARATALNNYKDAAAAIEREPEGEGKTVAESKRVEAEAAYKAAAATHDKARAALDKVQNGKAGVIFPPTGQALPVPSAHLIDKMRTKLNYAAAEKHAAIVDKKIEKARRAQVAAEENRHRQLLAAKITLGLQHGAGVPSHVMPHALKVVDTHAALKTAREGLELKRRAHDAAQSTLATTKRLAASKVRMPTDKHDYAARDGLEAKDTAQSALKDVTEKAAEARAQHSEAEIAHSNAQAAADQAVHSFTAALKTAPDASVGTMLPAGLTQHLQYEFDRARRNVLDPLHAFASGATPRAVKDFAISAGEHAASVAGHVKASAKDALNAAFMHTIDGKQVISIPKVLGSVALSGGALEALREHYKHARDAIVGTDEEKRAAKPINAPRGFKIATQIDPVSGEGFIGVHAPDPENKTDRILVWGERYRSGDSKGEALFPGSKLSDVRRRVGEAQQQRQQQGGGGSTSRDLHDAPSFGGPERNKVDTAISTLRSQNKMEGTKAEGAEMQFRSKADQDQNGAAGMFIQHVRTKFMNNAAQGLTGGFYHTALGSLFSNQGRVLKRGQAFSMLTGYTPSGEAKGHSIFKPDAGFKSQDKDEVAEALHNEADRVMAGNAPNHDRAKAALHLAIETVGQEKGLSREQIDGVHAKVRGAATAAPAPADKPVSTAWQGESPDKPREMPAGWSSGMLASSASAKANEIAPKLGIHAALVTPVIEHLARAVGHSHRFDESEATHVAMHAISDIATGDPANRIMGRDAIRSNDKAAFMGALQRRADEAKAKRVEKAAILLDDFEVLLKSFDPEAASGIGTRVAREGIDAAVEQGVKPKSGATVPGQAWHNPTRAGVETGALFGGELAAKTVARFIPGAGAASVALDGASRGAFGGAVQHLVQTVAGFGAKGIVRHAAPAVAGAAGYAGGLRGSEAASSTGYKPMPYSGLGEMAAEAGGQYAGAHYASKFAGKYVAGRLASSAVGRAASGVVGRVASSVGSAAAEAFGQRAGGIAGAIVGAPSVIGDAAVAAGGAYLGGVVARGGYDLVSKWFSGYGAHHQQGAAARFKPAPASASPAPAAPAAPK